MEDPPSLAENQPSPELQALGHQLAAARRDRGISLEDLASRLCIGHDQLRAIENADSRRLPEMVFVIAQARRVAASLGIDAEASIAALRAARRPPGAGASSTTAASGGAVAPRRSPANVSSTSGTTAPQRSAPAGAPLLLSLIGLALALGAGVLLWQNGQRQRAAVMDTRPAPSALPAPSGSSDASSATTASPAGAPASDHLVLQSDQDSWLEVRDSAGATVFEGTLKGTRSFPLGQGLRVMAGRPDLVTAQLAGRPAQVLGSIDQVIWRSFGPAGAPTVPGTTAEPPQPPAASLPPKAPAP